MMKVFSAHFINHLSNSGDQWLWDCVHRQLTASSSGLLDQSVGKEDKTLQISQPHPKDADERKSIHYYT